MTRDEMVAVMGVLRTAYPTFYKDMTRQAALDALALWTEMFADDDPRTVSSAVKALITTRKEGYPPTIGEVKAKIAEVTLPKEMTELEAWSLVEMACRNGLHGAGEEFEKLPPLIQKAVGSPNQLREWAMMDADTVKSVVASNFMRSFKVYQKRERETAMLPEDVKAMLEGVVERLALNG